MRTWKVFSKEANKLTRADFIFKLYMEMRIAYVETHTCCRWMWCNRRGAWEWLMCAFLIEILSRNKPIELRTWVCAWGVHARTHARAHLQWRQLFIVCFHCSIWKILWNFDWNRCASVLYLDDIFSLDHMLYAHCPIQYTKCISGHNNTRRRDDE